LTLANYTDLQTAVQDWMDRAGDTNFVAHIPDQIALGEAKLNRLLGPVETDATLTGIVSSNAISIAALSIVAPVGLFASFYASRETQLSPKYDGTFEIQGNAGRPRNWAIDGTNIVFDRPLDSAYSFRFRYQQRFALTVSATTNWLLTNHPDIYLAASLMWGCGYNEDWPNGQVWKGILDEGIPELKNTLARNRKADLSVDVTLQRIGRRWKDNSWVNEIL
jgi:hypothetical protein